jgi:hypothetical protein
MIVFDSDDMGANHVISDMCQSHDCRDMLMLFKDANPNFKATLFAIPGEMTVELGQWALENKDWIELAVHGFQHTSNYECADIKGEAEFFISMNHPVRKAIIDAYFVKGFKAPGWQIGNGCYQWLQENGYWVADQAYNDNRRPKDLPVYKVGDNSIHTHTWDCVGNGVYELKDQILERIKGETDFKFVSEVVQ